MTTPEIKVFKEAGAFAENKDIAKRLREEIVIPALREGRQVVIDFEGVSGVTQSFIHALVSESIRQFRGFALENLVFKNCNAELNAVIRIVFAYMQESIGPLD